MTFYDLAANRFSCRDFIKNKTVDRNTLTHIIDAARLAPSACNKQPWIFIVIDDACEPSCLTAISESYNRQWIESAPAFIIACGDHSQAWKRQNDNKDHTDIDLAIAIQHICLAASDSGLGTCWVCNFDSETLRKGLNIPPNLEPIAIIPIGYPSTHNIPKKTRKNIDDIIQWGKF